MSIGGRGLTGLSLCGALLLLLALLFPRYGGTDDAVLRQVFASVRANVTAVSEQQAPLVVLSFNLRYECPENNPDNHWSVRLPRIVALVEELRPTLLGLQEVDQLGPEAGLTRREPGSQLDDLLAALPRRYRLATRRPAPPAMAETPVQLYDSDAAELVEQDYLWLSETPRTPSSKSWDTSRPRVLNVARLRMRNGRAGADGADSDSEAGGLEVLAFNTHLDVRSESARRSQAALIRATVTEWQRRHPHAAVIVTGDWNAFPGQVAHRTMLTGGVEDSWLACAAPGSPCVRGGPAQSFHGYMGAAPLHSFLGRLSVGALATLHGMGVTFDAGSFSRGPLQAALAAARTWATVFSPPYSLRDALPNWPWSRLHVDWILFAQPGGVRAKHAYELRPAFVGVLDARDGHHSSDHFPLAAIFHVQLSGTHDASPELQQQQQQQQSDDTLAAYLRDNF